MKKFISKNKLILILASFTFIVIIPALINCLFKWASPCSFFVAEWNAGDALSFYGAILASIATILGVYFSIEHAQQSYREDEVNRVKPYFSLTEYSSRSKYNVLQDALLDSEEKESTEQSQSFYEEYKPKKIFIVIDKEGIHFKDVLLDAQQQCLKSGGLEWVKRDSGYRALESHPFISLPFDAENVGNGAAIDTMIAFYKKGENRRGIHLFTMKKEDSFYFHIFCNDADIVVDFEYIIELIYGDILGNCYTQKYPVKFSKSNDSRYSMKCDLIGKQEIDKTCGGKQ